MEQLSWSSTKLATTSRALPIQHFRHTMTFNFHIDNKPLQRKMWTKVVQSGLAVSVEGKIENPRGASGIWN